MAERAVVRSHATVTTRTTMYTQHGPDEGGETGSDTERHLFELKPLVRERLDRFPFERE